jgi:hypothetical protein
MWMKGAVRRRRFGWQAYTRELRWGLLFAFVCGSAAVVTLVVLPGAGVPQARGPVRERIGPLVRLRKRRRVGASHPRADTG